MSTWTSRARLFLLLLALGGCVAGPAQRSVTIGDGATAFQVAAPAGYCTAPQAVARTQTSDFAAFARCMAGPAASPVLTATVGAPGTGGPLDPAAVAAYFTSNEGRRALSRDNAAASVTVHEVLAADGAVLIRLTDRAPGSPGEGQNWRAVLTVGDRLVTLSVIGGRGAPLARDAGRMLALAFVAAVRRANSTAV